MKNVIEQGKEVGFELAVIKLLALLDDQTIADTLNIPLEQVQRIRKEHKA